GETRPRPNTGNPVRDTRVELLRLDDLVALGAQARDAHLDHVAWLQVTRWLRAVTHARRRPGGDHVTRAQRHEAADVGDQGRDREDHLAGVAVLAALAVHRRPQRHGLRIAGLVGGDEPRARRPERVGALALGGRAAVLHLERALGDVVHQAVAGDVAKRLRLVDIARVAPEHDAELH